MRVLAVGLSYICLYGFMTMAEEVSQAAIPEHLNQCIHVAINYFNTTTELFDTPELSELDCPVLLEDALYFANDAASHTDAHNHHLHYPVFALFVFVFIGAVIRYTLERHTDVPYTVWLLLVGLCIGAVGRTNNETKLYLDEFANIDPHLLLYVFLPLLVFESSFTLDTHVFRKSIVAILTLAVPGVIISTALQALVAVYLLPGLVWEWHEGLLLGSIVAATDPVAVVSLLRDLGASKTLAMLIEGESLVNDGTAIVIFTVLLETVTLNGDEVETGAAVGNFFYVALVGPIVGAVMGYISVAFLRIVYNDNLVESAIALCMPYLTYFIAEEYFHVSGVLAVVALGLYANVYGRTSISNNVEHFIHMFYEMMGYLANTVIFLMTGIIVMLAIDEVHPEWFLALAIIYITMHIIRGLVLTLFAPLLKRTGYGFSLNEGLVVMYGGLRGAVGLALGLVVINTELKSKTANKQFGEQLLFLVSGIVILTLFINGTTIRYLLKFLGMTQTSSVTKIQQSAAARHLNRKSMNKIDHLESDSFLADANWDGVREWLELSTIGRLPKELAEEAAELLEKERVAKQLAANTPPENVRELGDDVDLNQVMSTTHTQSLRTMSDMQKKSLREARRRFLKAENQSYWNQFSDGMIGQNEILALKELVSCALDELEDDTKPGRVNHQAIAHLMEIPLWLHHLYDSVNDVPLIGASVQNMIYMRLLFAFQIGVAYIRGQQAVQALIIDSNARHHNGEESKWAANTDVDAKLLSLVCDNLSARVVRHEAIENQRAMLAVLHTLREAYPEISTAVKTALAIHEVLKYQSHVVKELVHNGAVDDKFAEELTSLIEEGAKRINNARLVAEVYDKRLLISNIKWIKESNVDMDEIMKNVEEFTLDKDECLFREGDVADGVYVIARGVARVEHRVLGGEAAEEKNHIHAVAGNLTKADLDRDVEQRRVLARVGPHGMFGEMSVLTTGIRTADIFSETFMVVLRIKREYLVKCMLENPVLHTNLWQVASRKFALNLLLKTAPFSQWPETALNAWVNQGEYESFDTEVTHRFDDFLLIVLQGDVEIDLDVHIGDPEYDSVIMEHKRMSMTMPEQQPAIELNPNLLDKHIDSGDMSLSMSMTKSPELVPAETEPDSPVIFYGPVFLRVSAGTRVFRMHVLPNVRSVVNVSLAPHAPPPQTGSGRGSLRPTLPRNNQRMGGMSLENVPTGRSNVKSFIKNTGEHVMMEDHPLLTRDNPMSPSNFLNNHMKNPTAKFTWNKQSEAKVRRRRRSSLVSRTSLQSSQKQVDAFTHSPQMESKRIIRTDNEVTIHRAEEMNTPVHEHVQ